MKPTLKEAIESYLEVLASLPEWKQETKNIIAFRLKRKTNFGGKGDIFSITRIKSKFPATGIMPYNDLDFTIDACLADKKTFAPVYFRKTMIKPKSVICNWALPRDFYRKYYNLKYHFYDPYFPICGAVQFAGYKKAMVAKAGDKVEQKKYLCPKCVKIYNKRYANKKLAETIPYGAVVQLSKKPILTKGMIHKQYYGKEGVVVKSPLGKPDTTGDTVLVQFDKRDANGKKYPAVSPVIQHLVSPQIWTIYKSDLTVLKSATK